MPRVGIVHFFARIGLFGLGTPEQKCLGKGGLIKYAFFCLLLHDDQKCLDNEKNDFLPHDGSPKK